MFELRKRSKEVALASGLTLSALGMAACGFDDGSEAVEPVTTTAPQTVVEPQVEYYPLATGKDDRSEVFKVITLDDGRKITCIESHVLHPASGGRYDGGDFAEQGPEYDTFQDCDIESLAQQTTTTSTPR